LRPGGKPLTKVGGFFSSHTDELISVTELGYRVIGSGLTSVEVLDVHTAGAPGVPGSWQGARCEECAMVN
jgi:hypothetical protein